MCSVDILGSKTMRILILALVSLSLMAPLAAAEYYEGKPDCPPDQFCTTSTESGDPQSYGEGECVECSGPSDYPMEYDNKTDDCIDCNKPVDDSKEPYTRGEGSCMDGTAEYACRGDVQYLGGERPANDQEVDTSTKDKADVRAQDLAVPGVALAAVAAALGLVAIVVSRRK